MQIISSYGVELRKQNIPIRRTLEIYRSTVSYLIGIYVQVWEKLAEIPDALGVRLNIGGYACNLGLHSYVLFPCQIWLVPTLQVVRCISACIYAAFKSSISEWSFLRSA
jgi:hypothetical protein